MSFQNERELRAEARLQALEDFMAEHHGYQIPAGRPQLRGEPEQGRREDRRTQVRRYRP